LCQAAAHQEDRLEGTFSVSEHELELVACRYPEVETRECNIRRRNDRVERAVQGHVEPSPRCGVVAAGVDDIARDDGDLSLPSCTHYRVQL
jgi:hypothetical protein